MLTTWVTKFLKSKTHLVDPAFYFSPFSYLAESEIGLAASDVRYAEGPVFVLPEKYE